jgi:hypothetical protein
VAVAEPLRQAVAAVAEPPWQAVAAVAEPLPHTTSRASTGYYFSRPHALKHGIHI